MMYSLMIRKYWKQNKKRTLVSIVAISLTVSLMAFSLIFTQNLKETIHHSTKYSTGYYHFSMRQPEIDQKNILLNHDSIGRIGSIRTRATQMEGFNGTIQLTMYDKNATKIFQNMKMVSGEFPEKANEISLEQWLVDELGLEIGNEISVEGQVLLLVGILKSQPDFQSKNSSLGLLSSGQLLLEKPNKSTEFLYVQFKEELVTDADDIKGLLKSLPFDEKDFTRNDIVIKAQQEYEKPDYSAIFLIGVNLVILILSIYNIFNISVFEKTRLFGIMRGIGATPNQIRLLVLYESAIIGFISIPLGMKVAIVMQKSLNHFALFQNSTGFALPKLGMLYVAFISFITIIASALRPSYLAGKVSPINAIKMNQGLMFEKFKVSRENDSFLLRHFGLSSHLAFQNVIRNKTRFITTTLSMSIGIILIILSYSFFQAQDPASMLKKDYRHGSQYYLIFRSGIKDTDLKTLKQLVPSSSFHVSEFNASMGKDTRLDIVMDKPDYPHDRTYQTLKNFSKGKDIRLKSLFENIKSIEDDLQQVMKLLYGFVGIITLVGSFSILNTISTSLNQRTREFGMIRAVGLTGGQFLKIIIWEGLYYGIASALFGISMSVLLSYLQYVFVNYFIVGLLPKWDFPMEVCLLAVLLATAVSILAAILAARRIMKLRIIDSIKVE